MAHRKCDNSRRVSDQPSTDIAKKDVPYTVFSGFCMGTADVVPGVSGGTMAVALGIYHALLAAITSINRDAIGKLLKLRIKDVLAVVHWRFLVSLLGGVALGVGLMVKVVKLPHLVAHDSAHRPLVYAIFFGMVLGSAATLSRHLSAWKPQAYLSTVVGAGVGFGVVNLVPVGTSEHPAFIFVAGAIAICAMLLPGISGSFILLILGKYAYVLGALGDLNFAVILPFVLGCAVGILSFSRLLKFLLDRWHDTMLAGLIGLLIGSLWRIWPYQVLEIIIVREKPRVIKATPFMPDSFDFSLVGAFLVGVALVIGLEIYASKRKPKADA